MKNDKYFKKCITFGRAREGLRADFQEQMRELQNEIGFEYVRFHGLFPDDMIGGDYFFHFEKQMNWFKNS